MLPLLALLALSYAHPEQLVETDGFAAGHVPGAVYVSPVAIRDANSPPTFLPAQAAFESLMSSLGISNTTRVVVYDERGGIYAARLWWILNYFGHSNVALLDGGWVKWAAEQRATSTAAPSSTS